MLVYQKAEGRTHVRSQLPTLHIKLGSAVRALSVPFSFSSATVPLAHVLCEIKWKPTNELESLPLARVKRASSDIACRLIALARGYQKIDERIHNISSNDFNDQHLFAEIGSQLSAVSGAIAAHSEDFRRLRLTYGKFMFTRFNEKPRISSGTEEADDMHQSEAESDDNETESRAEKELVGDFFGLIDSDGDDQQARSDENAGGASSSFDIELEPFDVKLTHSQFAPVLKQLKTKIRPIRAAMKEREMRFLTAKGIHRDRILDVDQGNIDTLESNRSEARATGQTQPKFDEKRSLLQQKHRMLLIPSFALNAALGEEDILE